MSLLDDDELASFRDWLSERGAEVLEPTNTWEVLRFRANGETSVVYRNKQNRLRFTGESREAYSSWRGDRRWRGNERTDRRQLTPLHRTIRERDGDACFFCGEELADGEATVEHLVALTHGGPNHVSNIVLAHEGCNAEAGNMSVAEKVRMRERLRGASRDRERET